MFQTPTTRVWKKLYDEGKLNPAQRKFWESKPAEELYDLESDRDEVNNLAASPQHKAALERLRKAEREWVAQIRDVGFLPEGEIHSRAGAATPYELGRNESKFPMERIMAAAELAASLKPGVEALLIKLMADSDSAVRYWGAMGVLMRGEAVVKKQASSLEKALADSAPYPRIAAAEALGRYGNDAEAQRALDTLVALAPSTSNGPYVSLAAINAIATMGERARPAAAKLRAILDAYPNVSERAGGYGARALKTLLAGLSA